MVPVVDLSRRGARFADPFTDCVERIARSGSFLLGPELHGLETELGQWLGGPGCVAVSSGAAAIQLALQAIGVGPGDEVLVPAFTAVPTASAVAATGATPVPVDVDADTACVTASTLDAGRTTHTRAAIVVHLYGFPAALPDLGGLSIVEDAAQAIGALTNPARSVATAYSFYPTKNLGGIGDGGAVVSADPELLERVRLRRAHGSAGDYVHTAVSQNFRMSELEAAWLRLGLATLDADLARRRQIVARYRLAAPHLRWQAGVGHHAYHLAVFRSPQRETTRAQLAGCGVATAVHYPLAITQQPALRDLRHPPCPQAEAWAAECISVPCFAEITDDEVDTVCDALVALPAT